MKLLRHRNNERGIALILAIGFLAILSIIGAVVLTTSTRELTETSGFLPARRAFYTADQAVEYSMNRDIIVNLTPGTTVDFDDPVRNASGDPIGTLKHFHVVLNHADPDADCDDSDPVMADCSGPRGEKLVSGFVTDVGPRDLPPTLASIHGSDFGANMYHVEVDATAPMGGQTMESRVNASIVRLFKLDDDTIFRTSGGG